MYCFHKCSTLQHFLCWKSISAHSVAWLRIKYKEGQCEINLKATRSGKVLITRKRSGLQRHERALFPRSPWLMHHLWIGVITNWWMLSERRGAARTPGTEPERLGAALTQEIAPLRLEACYTSILLRPRAPNLDPATPPTPFILHLFPWLPTVACVCMYMYARLLTRVSHRSPASCRLPSWGDAWVLPVNFTAFIYPDEWRAVLSVPLPTISTGSLEPHRFALSLSFSLLPVHTQTHTHTHITQRYKIKHRQQCMCTPLTDSRLAYISSKHTLKAHKQPANPPSLFAGFWLAPLCSNKHLFIPPPKFLGETQKKSHLSSSLTHARDQRCDMPGEERRQEAADVAPGSGWR